MNTHVQGLFSLSAIKVKPFGVEYWQWYFFFFPSVFHLSVTSRAVQKSIRSRRNGEQKLRSGSLLSNVGVKLTRLYNNDLEPAKVTGAWASSLQNLKQRFSYGMECQQLPTGSFGRRMGACRKQL